MIKHPSGLLTRPPTTGHVTLLDNGQEEEDFSLIPDISGTPSSSGPDMSQDEDEGHNHGPLSINKIFPDLMNSGSYETLASFYNHSISSDTSRAILDRQELIEELSTDFYNSVSYSQLIEAFNPLIDYQYIASHEISLPVFLEPYQDQLTLAEISYKYYKSIDHADYLMRVNSLDSEEIPYKRDILVPPLYIYPENK